MALAPPTPDVQRRRALLRGGGALAAGAVLGAPCVAAQEVRLIAAETTFFCVARTATSGAHTTGLACDIVNELARRAGHSGQIALIPFARALLLGANSRSTMLAPVGRIPQRERQYTWIVKMFEDDFVVVAPRRSNVDISSLETCRRLATGVIRSGVAEHLAAEQHFVSVQPATSDVTNARKLAAGRIDAWLSSWNGILAAQAAAGLRLRDLRRGLVLRRVDVFLAGSLDITPAIAQQWRAAFQTMLDDGSHARLLAQYKFVLPE